MSFAGVSENVVMSQIFTTLTICPPLASPKLLSRSGLSVRQHFQRIQLNCYGGRLLAEALNPGR